MRVRVKGEGEGEGEGEGVAWRLVQRLEGLWPIVVYDEAHAGLVDVRVTVRLGLG